MVKSKPYKTCPYCGANLDPGEPCDCRDNTKGRSSEPEPVPYPYIIKTKRAAS